MEHCHKFFLLQAQYTSCWRTGLHKCSETAQWSADGSCQPRGQKRRTGQRSVLHRVAGKVTEVGRITGVCQDSLENCRTAAVSFVRSFRLYAGNNWCYQWTDFCEICIFERVSKIFSKIQVLLNSNNNNRYFTCRPIYTFDHISLSSS